MSGELSFSIIDTHAGGDVSRIVVGGINALPGTSVREQMAYLRDEADGLRTLLLEEPYGIAEMSVDLIVPPTDPQASAGYIIMEVMGYPIYSGSNTICTATALLESGMLAKREGRQPFLLESPAGLVRVEANVSNGVVEAITCAGLPSYIDTYRATIHVPLIGDVTYSVAYSGGFYALVDARELGFELIRAEESRLAHCARAIVAAILEQRDFAHYSLGNVGPLAFLHFMGPVEQITHDHYRSRSATYVHPGVICRSTTGTGTSARMALMHYEGRLKPGDQLETVSLRGSSFVGAFTRVARGGPHDVVENTITGKSHALAHSRIVVNPDDPLVDSTQLRPILSRNAQTD